MITTSHSDAVGGFLLHRYIIECVADSLCSPTSARGLQSAIGKWNKERPRNRFRTKSSLLPNQLRSKSLHLSQRMLSEFRLPTQNHWPATLPAKRPRALFLSAQRFYATTRATYAP